MNLTTSLQKKFVKYLLLIILLIILINNDLLVLEGGKLPGKLFNEPLPRPVHVEPGYKGNSNSGNKFGNDFDDFGIGIVAPTEEAGKTESSDNLVIVVVIAVIIIPIIFSIYAWYKRRNRNLMFKIVDVDHCHV
jgi:hypothetical protein